MTPRKFNEWRVMPRLSIIFYLFLSYKTASWFMGLNEPSVEQAGFAGAIISAAAVWFGFYVNSGAKLEELK